MRARKVLAGRIGSQRCRRPHAKWLDALHLKALQSALFNECLASRMRAGRFGVLLPGDLVSQPNSFARPRLVHAASESPPDSHDSGAAEPKVPAEDASAHASGEISYTGPLFAADMRQPRGITAELEASVWKEYMPDMSLSAIKPPILSGSRRVGRLPLPSDLQITECKDSGGLTFRFSLPCGAFATSLLREFVGQEVDSHEEPDDCEEPLVAEKGPDDGAEDSRKVAPWTKAGTVGLRISCESQIEEKKAFAQCLELLEAFRSADAAEGLHCSKYSVVRTGVAGLLLVCSSSGALQEPVTLAVRALQQALVTGSSPVPLVVRMLPMQCCCAARVDSILQALQQILNPFEATEDGKHTYRIEIKQRGSVKLDSPALIKAIGGLVEQVSPHAQPDLELADTAITVDIFDGTACLAVLPEWSRLHNYNLRKAAAAGAAASAAQG